ncbi:MAG: cryptochrome/photolyase family protein [Pseudomonadota bacterium]
MTTLRLILGDQLNAAHPWFRDKRDDVLYVMAELRQEGSYVRHHAQKLIGFLAAMRAFAAALQQAGHRLHYVRITEPDAALDFVALLQKLARHHRATALAFQLPDEWRLDRQLDGLEAATGLPVTVHDSQHFYTTREDVGAFFGQKQWRMEWFYREMRRRHGILLEADGEPVGGQWNFDADNREKWKGDPPAPVFPQRSRDLREVWADIQAAGLPYFGNPRAGAFPWPVTRSEARADLRDFIEQRLPYFGRYQDAMSSASPMLFHARLSFALNTKMLSPREVVDAALVARRSDPARYPLAAVEGFVRQILGWREYIRGVYWARMPGYAQENFFEAKAPLPDFFWTGNTDMACLRHAITQSLEWAYAHHIQRLMVTGNYALLAGLDPDAVDAWYLGIYIDALEWVELPNTRGMALCADGGFVGSKPYAAGGAYLKRMGDYCKDCRYDPAAKGENACPLTGLYWDFMRRHPEKLKRFPRLWPVLKNARARPPSLPPAADA